MLRLGRLRVEHGNDDGYQADDIEQNEKGAEEDVRKRDSERLLVHCYIWYVLYVVTSVRRLALFKRLTFTAHSRCCQRLPGRRLSVPVLRPLLHVAADGAPERHRVDSPAQPAMSSIDTENPAPLSNPDILVPVYTIQGQRIIHAPVAGAPGNKAKILKRVGVSRLSREIMARIESRAARTKK